MDNTHVAYGSKEYLQDLQIYVCAIDKQNFKLANTLANRIMPTEWVFDKKKIGILGFCQKQLAVIDDHVLDTQQKANMVDCIDSFTAIILNNSVDMEKSIINQIDEQEVVN